jgi:hypothetical protein
LRVIGWRLGGDHWVEDRWVEDHWVEDRSCACPPTRLSAVHMFNQPHSLLKTQLHPSMASDKWNEMLSSAKTNFTWLNTINDGPPPIICPDDAHGEIDLTSELVRRIAGS